MIFLVFYLPGVCTQTDTKGKQRKARVRNILKSLKKNTIFNEHPVCTYVRLVKIISREEMGKLGKLAVTKTTPPKHLFDP